MADKEYAPWSRETSDGLITSAVDSHVRVSQDIVPALAVGSIDKLSGKWEGVTVSDSIFLVDPVHEAVANGATVLSPQASDHEYIDMTGFNDLQIAIKPSVTGNYTLTAVQGPDTYAYANLIPVNASGTLRGNGDWYASSDFEGLMSGTESLAADVWNIFTIITRLSNQKLLQFKITNATGSPANIQFASLRVV